MRRLSFLVSLVAFLNLAHAQDVIELKTIAIIGNRELPKTLVIVPWKDPVVVPVPAPRTESVLDEVPTGMDLDTLRRRADLFSAGFVLD